MIKEIEICCGSLQSCIAAQNAGAQRVELCSVLSLGGVTPSYGEISQAKNNLTIDIHVLIRPRQGDFLYSSSEIDVMLEDIEMCAQLEIDGVVLGALDKYGQVDEDVTKLLTDFAKKNGMSVTFHRAIDVSVNIFKSLDTIAKLGIDRVLTSGGQNSAFEGIDVIAEMQRRSGGQVVIMPGAGIDSSNIVEIIEKTGVEEVHFSGSKERDSSMLYRPKSLSFTPEVLGGDYKIKNSSELKIRTIMDVLRKHKLLSL